MVTCTSCGYDVTGKKFCQQCGTPVQPTGVPAPSSLATPVCNTCGQNLQAASAAPVSAFCTNCGQKNAPGVRFCASCGNQLGMPAAPVQPVQPGYTPSPGQYPPPQQPYQTAYGQQPYAQQNEPQYQQPYGQPQYPQQ